MYKRIISLSLGSSLRDMGVEALFGGHTFHIERIGTDGSLDDLMKGIEKYSKTSDIITLGGMDLNLVFTKRKYMFKDAARLVKTYQNVHIVDGERYKEWMEPLFFKKVFELGILPQKAKILFPLAANRIPLIKSMMDSGYDNFVFGDLIFDIGFPPVKIKKLGTYEAIGYFAGPIITKLPFSWIYPTGAIQEHHKVKKPELFKEADIIAGDYHNIHIHLPEDLGNKTIITNTITTADTDILKKRGLKYLVTLSPSFKGRTFGSNVMDGVITCYLAEKGQVTDKGAYINAADTLCIKPEIRRLNY